MTIESTAKSVVDNQLGDATMSDAIAQLKAATSNVYDAVGSLGHASATKAKAHLQEGKTRAIELEQRAEELFRERPLVTIGLAFVAGYVVSRLLKSHD